jgi:hypothetical protein
MKWLGYIWRVAVNLFYLLIVAAVLSGIRDPSEKSIISVLGLLYVTIRSIGISQGLASMGVIAAFQRQIDQIQFRVDGTFEMPDRTEELAYVETVRNKLYIDSFFLALITLICLFAFFTAHG